MTDSSVRGEGGGEKERKKGLIARIIRLVPEDGKFRLLQNCNIYS